MLNLPALFNQSKYLNYSDRQISISPPEAGTIHLDWYNYQVGWNLVYLN